VWRGADGATRIAVLTVNDAIRIRTVARTAQRGELGKLANEYGVSLQYIYNIARGSSWREADMFAPPVTEAPWMHVQPLAAPSKPTACPQCRAPYTFTTDGNGRLMEWCACNP
jgi:hypothetical protein